MDYNYENLIVTDIFTDSEIDAIYEHVEQAPEEKKHFVSVFSHTAYMTWMPDDIVNTIVAKAQETTDKKLALRELSFARYKKVSDDIPVCLTPHRDETFREPRITMDIQLKSNIDWPIVVEGRSYQLKDNQALTFAGTHQVHWRPKIQFGDEDFLDMIFCHFSEEGVEPNILGPMPEHGVAKSEHDARMQKQADHWTKIYNES
jgi:hypothetical protein